MGRWGRRHVFQDPNLPSWWITRSVVTFRLIGRSLEASSKRAQSLECERSTERQKSRRNIPHDEQVPPTSYLLALAAALQSSGPKHPDVLRWGTLPSRRSSRHLISIWIRLTRSGRQRTPSFVFARQPRLEISSFGLAMLEWKTRRRWSERGIWRGYYLFRRCRAFNAGWGDMHVESKQT